MKSTRLRTWNWTIEAVSDVIVGITRHGFAHSAPIIGHVTVEKPRLASQLAEYMASLAKKGNSNDKLRRVCLLLILLTSLGSQSYCWAANFPPGSSLQSWQDPGLSDLLKNCRNLPQFGAHIERFLGTLMKRIHGLPGTTYVVWNR
ncbi:MAG TPA: hypothetical protein VGL34_09540 [Steroidobacteraceae bacterium]|jgi:hypothetical protein